jgi:hypothetical protein
VVAVGSSALASTRVIRSRSVTMPSIWLVWSMTSTLPQPARVITQAASCTVAVGARLSTWRRDIAWKIVRSDMAGSCDGRHGFSAMRR